MSRDPEGRAARLLGGVMPAAEQRDFTRHLLTCPQCWDEVDQGRRGRNLAEATRTIAPPALRDRVRELVEAESLEVRTELASLGHPRRRWLLVAVLP